MPRVGSALVDLHEHARSLPRGRIEGNRLHKIFRQITAGLYYHEMNKRFSHDEVTAPIVES
jgi:hypothetical protein